MGMTMVKHTQEQWEPAAAPPSAVKAENILLVDDLPANLMVYRNILEELGQNLVVTSSGEEALKFVLKQDFAVILLDVNMPTMNGFETAALIRRRKKSASTPIIFLTAFTDEVNMIQGYASGAVDYLPTPVVPEVLKAKVRVFIELSQMRRQAALQAEERVRREAAEESAQKSAFLAKASESLARSQSQKELLHVLTQLPVPDLADVATVWYKDDDVSEEQTAWGFADSIAENEPPLCRRSDFSWLEKTIKDVVATGHSRILDDLTAYQSSPVLPLETWRSAVALPIAVQGQTRGALVLLYKKNSNRSHTVKNMFLGSDLAYRAGVALENVMLVERIREADRRKDEFLGMLAHELRNPLGPIYNSLQLQKMLSPADPRQADLHNIIDRQAKHMGRLIDDLLDATRLAHRKILLRKECCDLAVILCQTVEDYRNVISADGLTLNLSTPDEAVWVDGDPTRLVQAIGNLLHNAHKFSASGGTIEVKLEADKKNFQAVITVADTGIGIEPHMLRCVFDVFRQAEQGLDRNRGGLGLGLTLVKGLVELHGGTVHAASQGHGKGAEFRICLPTLLASDRAGALLSVAPDTGDKKYRILVIEDNRDSAESIRMLLAQEGHDVKMAFTAENGLGIARDFHPQIILCDIGLPVVDGYQIIQTIRCDAELASTYAIALTGYGRENDKSRALDAGFNLHLTKPVDYASLRRALAHAGAMNKDISS